MDLRLVRARLFRPAPRVVLVTSLVLVAAGCASATRSAGSAGAPPVASSRTHQASPTTPARTSSSHPRPRTRRTRPSTIARGECRTTALKITFINNQDAAGHAYDDLDFANRSRATCFIEGWPGVSYARAAGGRLVGAPAHRARGRTRRVVLVPGATAHAPLTFADNASETPSQCGASVSADWLRIYPPDQYSATFVSLGFSIPACSHAQFWIGTVRPRSANSS